MTSKALWEKIQTLVFLSLKMIHKWLSELNLQGEFFTNFTQPKVQKCELGLDFLQEVRVGMVGEEKWM